MRFRRAVLGLPVTIALAAACSGDDTTTDEPSVAAQSAALSGSTSGTYVKGARVTVQPDAMSRDAARDAVRADLAGDVYVRKSHCFAMVRASETALAQAADDAGRVDTLITFLGHYGSAFTDVGAPALSGPVELEVSRPAMVVREGSAESTHVLLRQRVDGFVFADSVIGGKFVGKDLVQVAGCLVDPATSAPRAKSLAVPDAEAAREAFGSALGPDVTADTAPVIGRFTGRIGMVEWTLRDHRLDAVTGAYLGKMEPPKGDPVTPTQSVGQ